MSIVSTDLCLDALREPHLYKPYETPQELLEAALWNFEGCAAMAHESMGVYHANDLGVREMP